MTVAHRSDRVTELMQAAMQPLCRGPVILIHPCDGFVSARCARTAAFLAARLDGEVIGLGRTAPAESEGDELLDALTEVAALRFHDILREAHAAGRWIPVAKTDLPTMARAATAADLIVTACESEEGFDPETADLRRLMMACSRPIYVCHDDGPPRADRILLCWNGSPQARRAMLDAMPLLRCARQVVVLKVCARAEREEAAAQVRDVAAGLASRGIAAKPLAQPLLDGRVTDVIREVALREGADLLVAGAYGRGPLAHALSGSRTDALLRSTPLPFFLSR